MPDVDDRGAISTASVMARLKDKLRDLLALVPSGSRIALLDEPVHRNIGDHLIQIASESFFAEHDIDIVYRANVWNYKASHCRALLDGDTILVFLGGGHLGDLYPHHQDLREQVLRDFPDHKAVILPQSIHFQSAARLEQAKAAFDAHKHLHICIRDRASSQFAQEHFSAPVHLVPDMAHQLWPMVTAEPVDQNAPVLFLIRRDKESSGIPATLEPYRQLFIDWNQLITYKDELILICCVAGFLLGKQHHSFSRYTDRAIQQLRRKLIGEAVSLFTPHEKIASSRLHGVLLGLLLGKEVTALPSTTGKTTAYHATWLGDIPALKPDDKTTQRRRSSQTTSR